MKTIVTSIMVGLATIVSASAGPERITVTNEAGVVFKDAEVLSRNAGVLSIKTTNGVEFIKEGNATTPTTNQTTTTDGANASKDTKLFTFKAGKADAFDGHKRPDEWKLFGRNKQAWVFIFLEDGQSKYVQVVHYTKEWVGMESFKIRVGSEILELDDDPVLNKNRTETLGDEAFSVHRLAYEITPELFEKIKNASEIKLRIVGDEKYFDYDFPTMRVK